MYTAITRFPLLTIKNYITESRLLNKVEVNSIEIKLEINFFRQNLYAPLAGRINYIAVKCFFFRKTCGTRYKDFPICYIILAGFSIYE